MHVSIINISLMGRTCTEVAVCTMFPRHAVWGVCFAAHNETENRPGEGRFFSCNDQSRAADLMGQFRGSRDEAPGT